jgi:hypothetical protein
MSATNEIHDTPTCADQREPPPPNPVVPASGMPPAQVALLEKLVTSTAELNAAITTAFVRPALLVETLAKATKASATEHTVRGAVADCTCTLTFANGDDLRSFFSVVAGVLQTAKPPTVGSAGLDADIEALLAPLDAPGPPA